MNIEQEEAKILQEKKLEAEQMMDEAMRDTPDWYLAGVRK